MELVAILRLLWARRILVGVGAVLATAACAAAVAGPVATSLRPSALGIATARLFLDTPSSQLVRAAPKAVDTLPMRATLLADLLASEPIRARIAHRSGVPREALDVLGPSSRVEPGMPTPLATAAAAAEGARGAYQLRVYAAPDAPTIAIDAQAPTARAAAALVQSATTALRSLLPAGGRSDAFVLRTLAAPHAKQVPTDSRRRLVALFGALALFPLWCGGLVIAAGLAGRARARRRAAQPC